MWKEGDYIHFECTVEETGKTCLTGGWIKLSQDNLETEEPSENILSSNKCDNVFQNMAEKLTPDMVKNVNAVFRWIITDDKKTPVAQWSSIDTDKNGPIGENLKKKVVKKSLKTFFSQPNKSENSLIVSQSSRK